MGPLLELLDDLRRRLATGPAARGARLRPAQALRGLAARAPALARVADLAERAGSAGPAALCDLLLALAVARPTLASTGRDGELVPVEASGPWATATPADDLYQVVRAVERKVRDPEEVLKRAIKSHQVADLRLVEPLLRCLRVANSDVVERAADEALPAFGPAVVPELLAGLSLQGKTADGRRLRALCRIDRGFGADWCRRALREGNAYLRVEALRCLPLAAPAAEVVRTARDWLAHDRNVWRRWQAVEVLREVGRAAAPAVPELIATLGDGGTSLELTLPDAVADALAGVGPPALAPLTEALRTHADPKVRAGAARALLKMGPRKASAAVPALHEALADAAAEVRSMAGAALSSIAPQAPETVPALAALLKAKGRNAHIVRRDGAYYLGRLGEPARAAVPALLEALQDPDRDVRDYASIALTQVVPDRAEAVAPLVRALREDSSWKVRSQAAEALGKMARLARRAATDLAAALGDPDPAVATSAAEALAAIAAEAPSAASALPATAVPTLARLLPAAEPWARRAALRLLALFGRRAAGAVPALTALLETETDADTRREARKALVAADQSTSVT
jgi:HEAT repeat protein